MKIFVIHIFLSLFYQRSSVVMKKKKCKSEYVMRILFWTFFRGNHLEWPLVNPLDIPESSPSESSIPGNEKENKINKLERGGP